MRVRLAPFLLAVVAATCAARGPSPQVIAELGRARALVRDGGLEVVDSRQHSLVGWAAWALPRGQEAAWLRLSRMERRVPPRLNRWGAHLELVATATG